VSGCCAGDAVTALLTDVLTLDKMEQGQFELTVKPACLECLVRSAVRMFRPAATAQRVQLEVTCTDEAASTTHRQLIMSAESPMARQSTRSGSSFLFQPITSSGVELYAHPSHALSLVSGSATATAAAPCEHSPHAMVVIDPTRMHQILRNLLSNALKFTVRGSVSVHLRYGHDMVDISVQDTGIGMDQASLDRLFMPYVQFASDLHKGQGSGLGLSIAKRLAQLHGGDLTCESAPNQGSTFSLRFPAKRASSALVDSTPSLMTRQTSVNISDDGDPAVSIALSGQESTASATVASSVSAAGLLNHASVGVHSATPVSSVHRYINLCKQTLGPLEASIATPSPDEGARLALDHPSTENAAPLNIGALGDTSSAPLTAASSSSITEAKGHCALVVDDSELNVKLMCRLLASRGWRTDKAYHGEAAVELVTSGNQQYHVIFMDLNMPVMDGSEAVSLIRQRGCTATIIGLTGDVSKETVSLFMQAGTSAVMAKPIDVRALDEVLSSLTQRDAVARSP